MKQNYSLGVLLCLVATAHRGAKELAQPQHDGLRNGAEPELAADGGLAQAKLTRCAGKAALVGDDGESAQLLEIHRESMKAGQRRCIVRDGRRL